MNEFNVDKTNSQYKGPLNTIISDSNVFTYKDTTIVMPNSATPYSLLQADLRAKLGRSRLPRFSALSWEE